MLKRLMNLFREADQEATESKVPRLSNCTVNICSDITMSHFEELFRLQPSGCDNVMPGDLLEL